jgi:hypothetical protein
MAGLKREVCGDECVQSEEEVEGAREGCLLVRRESHVVLPLTWVQPAREENSGIRVWF